MRFGPDLYELSELAGHSAVDAVLEFTPPDAQFEYEVEIYVEDFGGMNILKLSAKSATMLAEGPPQPAP